MLSPAGLGLISTSMGPASVILTSTCARPRSNPVARNACTATPAQAATVPAGSSDGKTCPISTKCPCPPTLLSVTPSTWKPVALGQHLDADLVPVQALLDQHGRHPGLAAGVHLLAQDVLGVLVHPTQAGAADHVHAAGLVDRLDHARQSHPGRDPRGLGRVGRLPEGGHRHTRGAASFTHPRFVPRHRHRLGVGTGQAEKPAGPGGQHDVVLAHGEKRVERTRVRHRPHRDHQRVEIVGLAGHDVVDAGVEVLGSTRHVEVALQVPGEERDVRPAALRAPQPVEARAGQVAFQNTDVHDCLLPVDLAHADLAAVAER